MHLGKLLWLGLWSLHWHCLELDRLDWMLKASLDVLVMNLGIWLLHRSLAKTSLQVLADCGIYWLDLRVNQHTCFGLFF